MPEPVRVAFVCVQNAGRSQMAAAFAGRERDRRGLGDAVEVLTGGTDPADGVHDEVVAVMAEAGVDLAGRVPREITTAELESCDYVATMGCSAVGCSTLALDPVAGVDLRDWALDDPDGEDTERVCEIRDEVEDRVRALFDEVEERVGTRTRPPEAVDE